MKFLFTQWNIVRTKKPNRTTDWFNISQNESQLCVCGLHIPAWPLYSYTKATGLTSQTRTGALENSRTCSPWCNLVLVDRVRHDVPDVLKWIQVLVRAVQSIALMASSRRKCRHTSAKWGMWLSEGVRRIPEPAGPSYGPTMGLDLILVLIGSLLPLASTRRAVRPSKEVPPQTITDQLQNDGAGSELFWMSSDFVMSVTCA